MGSLESSFFDIGHLDALSNKETAIHRVDPRVKVLTTFCFIVVVVSFQKYDLVRLMPFSIYPISVMAIGDIPFSYILKKLLLSSPFVIFMAMFNPILDRSPAYELGVLSVSGGFVSFASIIAKFALTVSAALATIACTGFDSICSALGRMGVPSVLTVQLLLVYRYIFVMGEEAARMARSRALRSFGNRGMGMSVYAAMIGQLLLRTMDRGQRIHLAMLCRGFDGNIRYVKMSRIRPSDLLFFFGWTGVFILLRLYNLPAWLGTELGRLI